MGNPTQVRDSGMGIYWDRVMKEEYKENEDLKERWLKMFLGVAVQAEAITKQELPEGFLEDLTEREKKWEL